MTGLSQEEVTVKVTVVEPPHRLGAPVLLLLIAALQPPERVYRVNQFAKLLSIPACVKQEGLVLFGGQESATAGAAATVNDAEQVTGA